MKRPFQKPVCPALDQQRQLRLNVFKISVLQGIAIVQTINVLPVKEDQL